MRRVRYASESGVKSGRLRDEPEYDRLPSSDRGRIGGAESLSEKDRRAESWDLLCFHSEKSRLLAASFCARAAAVSNEKRDPIEDGSLDLRALLELEADDDFALELENDLLPEDPDE